MNSNDTKNKTHDPSTADTPVPNPANLPHGTTNDQINEMESEGQATKPGQEATAPRPGKKSEAQKGAVEGDRASDKEPGNRNAVGSLDRDGLPKNKKAIAEDSIGARADQTQG